jgi:hypothetical protein
MANDDYLKTVCPKCLDYNEYLPNPTYIHKCKSCKKSMGESDLITVVEDKKVDEEINNLTALLKRFPTRESLIEKKKSKES